MYQSAKAQPKGGFAQLTYQVLDQDGQPFAAANIEVREALINEYTVEQTVFGGISYTPSTNSNPNISNWNGWSTLIRGGTSLTAPNGTFYDRPFGGCGNSGWAIHGGTQLFAMQWEGQILFLGQQNYQMSLFTNNQMFFAATGSSQSGWGPPVPSWTWNNFPR